MPTVSNFTYLRQSMTLQMRSRQQKINYILSFPNDAFMKSKKTDNDQELIQSNPTFHPPRNTIRRPKSGTTP